VHGYFLSGDFTGAAFDTFAGGGDAFPDANTFTASDLVAITMLGVRLPGRGALQILDGRSNDLLARIPLHLDLTDEDCPADVIDQWSPVAELWRRLCEEINGAGWVVAHKLCARKRPRLLPVYDDVVKRALQPNHDPLRVPLWRELRDPALVSRLHEVRSAAGLDERVPLLRVLDAAVWMRNEGITQVKRDRPAGLAPLPFLARDP
jgi:hypothetical protein